MAKIIAVANQKGGVGKTTTAVNLASAVADKGRRVLLVDLDPQGNATSGLGVTVKNGYNLYSVMSGECSAKEAIRRTRFGALSVLPSSVDLSGSEIELVMQEHREEVLKHALNSVSGEYDYIFIDSPPSLGLLTINALTAANSVLIPIQCEYYALEGVGQLMNTLTLVRKRLNPALDVEGVVLTMLDGRTNLGLQVVSEVKKHFKGKVFSTVVPRNVRLSEAPSHGVPIQVYDANCTGAAAYSRLGDELIKRNEG